jgi:hypothetical protein
VVCGFDRVLELELSVPELQVPLPHLALLVGHRHIELAWALVDRLWWTPVTFFSCFPSTPLVVRLMIFLQR